MQNKIDRFPLSKDIFFSNSVNFELKIGFKSVSNFQLFWIRSGSMDMQESNQVHREHPDSVPS